MKAIKSGFGFQIINKKTGKYFHVGSDEKTMKNLRKRIFSYAKITDEEKRFLGNYYILIQLSYAKNSDWNARQLTAYIRSVINLVGRENVFDYGWVMEVKPTGRNLHYHLAIHTTNNIMIPKPDKSGMWKYGSSNIYGGKSSPYYLAKYVSKEAQKYAAEFPKGARKYSTWLNKDYYSEAEIYDHRKSAYPNFVVDKIEELGIMRFKLRRTEAGSDVIGWVITVLDDFHPLEGINITVESPWVMCLNMRELKRWFPESYEKEENNPRGQQEKRKEIIQE